MISYGSMGGENFHFIVDTSAFSACIIIRLPLVPNSYSLTQPHSNLPNHPCNCRSSNFPTIPHQTPPDDGCTIPTASQHPLGLFWVHRVVVVDFR